MHGTFSTAEAATSTRSPALDVLVIGAGFAGIATAHRLSKVKGLRFLVVDKGSRPGGTWRDNTYPGCACDIPAHLYSLSFAPNPDWSRMFASQSEILAYVDRVIHHFDLARHIRLDTVVTAVDWDETAHVWRVSFGDGSSVTARTVVSAVGVLHHPAFPDIEGIASFRGRKIHTAEWDHTYDLTGKRVAVIGTGASAVQVVPAIADKVASLAVFQRTPPWIVPRFDRAFDEKARRKLRNPLYRLYFRSRLFYAHEKRATGFTKQNLESLAKTEALCRSLLERQVKDPALRQKLTPDYTVGCKRLIVSSDYYPALQLPNVELITDRIVRIDETAVVTADGRRHEVDAIVFSTGYDAQRPLSHLPITGPGGRPLQQVWEEDGMHAYLGTTVTGFPNLFLITGPNTGGGHNSQVFMIEAQVDYIAKALRAMRRRRATRLEVTPEAQQAFADDMDRRMKVSVWTGGGCRSWFLDPRTGRNNLLWPSYSTDFWLKTRVVRSRDYRFARHSGRT